MKERAISTLLLLITAFFASALMFSCHKCPTGHSGANCAVNPNIQYEGRFGSIIQINDSTLELTAFIISANPGNPDSIIIKNSLLFNSGDSSLTAFINPVNTTAFRITPKTFGTLTWSGNGTLSGDSSVIFHLTRFNSTNSITDTLYYDANKF